MLKKTRFWALAVLLGVFVFVLWPSFSGSEDAKPRSKEGYKALIQSEGRLTRGPLFRLAGHRTSSKFDPRLAKLDMTAQSGHWLVIHVAWLGGREHVVQLYRGLRTEYHAAKGYPNTRYWVVRYDQKTRSDTIQRRGGPLHPYLASFAPDQRFCDEYLVALGQHANHFPAAKAWLHEMTGVPSANYMSLPLVLVVSPTGHVFSVRSPTPARVDRAIFFIREHVGAGTAKVVEDLLGPDTPSYPDMPGGIRGGVPGSEMTKVERESKHLVSQWLHHAN